MPYQIRLRPGALAVMNSLDAEERHGILEALQKVASPSYVDAVQLRRMSPLRGEQVYGLDGIDDLRVVFTNPTDGVLEVQDLINRECAATYGSASSAVGRNCCSPTGARKSCAIVWTVDTSSGRASGC